DARRRQPGERGEEERVVTKRADLGPLRRLHAHHRGRDPAKQRRQRGQRLAVGRRRQRGHGRHRQRRGRLGRVGRRLDHVVDGGGGESAEGSGGGKDKQGGRWTHGRRFGQV